MSVLRGITRRDFHRQAATGVALAAGAAAIGSACSGKARKV